MIRFLFIFVACCRLGNAEELPCIPTSVSATTVDPIDLTPYRVVMNIKKGMVVHKSLVDDRILLLSTPTGGAQDLYERNNDGSCIIYTYTGLNRPGWHTYTSKYNFTNADGVHLVEYVAENKSLQNKIKLAVSLDSGECRVYSMFVLLNGKTFYDFAFSKHQDATSDDYQEINDTFADFRASDCTVETW